MQSAATGQLPRRTLVVAWIALVGAEVLTQLSLKFASRVTGGFDFSAAAFARAIGSGWLWVAIASYCGIFLAWMLILRDSNLSRAFPTSAIVFVAIMLVSWLVLHEPIGPIQLVGATVIVAGILHLRQPESVAPPQAAHLAPPSPTTME